MNKFAQLLYGEVLFILETNMEMTELSTVFSPKTYWVDITGKDVSVGDIVEYGAEGFTFRHPTIDETVQKEVRQVRENLNSKAISAMMRMLAGNAITDDKYEYQTQLMSISDAVALKMPDVFPEWSDASVFYRKDMKLTYNGVLYKVLQDHTSQASWTPDVAPSLFAKVLVSDDGTPQEWQQPDSTNAYMTGDRVTFEGHVYESLIDNNVWSPTAYPQGWKLIDDEGEE